MALGLAQRAKVELRDYRDLLGLQFDRIASIGMVEHVGREKLREYFSAAFTEGASVEILHEGLFGRDPIAVRINDATVAIRRREAMAILVS